MNRILDLVGVTADAHHRPVGPRLRSVGDGVEPVVAVEDDPLRTRHRALDGMLESQGAKSGRANRLCATRANPETE